MSIFAVADGEPRSLSGAGHLCGPGLQAWVDRLIDFHDDGGGDDTTVLALRMA